MRTVQAPAPTVYDQEASAVAHLYRQEPHAVCGINYKDDPHNVCKPGRRWEGFGDQCPKCGAKVCPTCENFA